MAALSARNRLVLWLLAAGVGLFTSNTPKALAELLARSSGAGCLPSETG